MKVAGSKFVGWVSVSFVSLLVVGLPNLRPRDYADLYKRIEIGMTSEQVLAIAGPPENAYGGHSYQLIYSNSPVLQGALGRSNEAVLVLFCNGRVTNVMLTQGSGSLSKADGPFALLPR